MNIKCFHCGNVYQGNFCPNCSAPARPPIHPVNYQNSPQPSPSQVKRKNNKLGCLVIVLIIIFIFIMMGIVGTIFASMSTSDTDDTSSNLSETQEITKAPSDEEIKSSLIEFDTKSWDDFKLIYISHNYFIKSLDAYANDQITSLDFYDRCNEVQEYFQNASMAFDYGTTDDEETYLSVFETAALSDQQAAEALIKYIDSGKTSDLSKAQEHIKKAKSAFEMIASNRGTLLVKAGLTKEEISKKVKADMAQLEAEMNQ